MREYAKDWSPALGREMEVLRFGREGRPILVFPTSMGRFYQWEDFGMVGALADRIDAGEFHLWCVDSVDEESWYEDGRHPRQRVERHMQYERYICDELVPRMDQLPITVGASFGAMHAVLLALRRPRSFSGFIGLSGAYDTARWLHGYSDDETYFTNPFAFLPELTEERYLEPIRAMTPKVIATGETDANVEDSRRLAELLAAKDLGVRLDIWDGWAHDWPYWKEMMQRYV